MSDQWRFQWPDGTWIRWNPQTQAWEKETAGAEAAPVAEVAASAPVLPPVEVVEVDESVATEETSVAAPVDLESALGAVPRVEEPETHVEEPAETFPSRRERRTGQSGRARRSMIGDVLPPRPEPDRPGGSLWPTVITGMVVGLGVGLLIWNLIR